jgi:curved DNA-binding protein CbpA
MENIRQSLYEVIGVPHYATEDEIKNACFSLGELYRPDKNPNSEYCAARFSAIERAYLVLCNPETRKVHDRHLAHTGTLPTSETERHQVQQPSQTLSAVRVVKRLMQAF